jgi:hypothetical protein
VIQPEQRQRLTKTPRSYAGFVDGVDLTALDPRELPDEGIKAFEKWSVQIRHSIHGR